MKVNFNVSYDSDATNISDEPPPSPSLLAEWFPFSQTAKLRSRGYTNSQVIAMFKPDAWLLRKRIGVLKAFQ